MNKYLQAMFMFTCMFFVRHSVYAQEVIPEPDYTQIGSPMPRLSYMEWIDTSMTGNVAKAGKRKKNATVMPTVGYYKLTDAVDYAGWQHIAVMIFSPECKHCNKVVSMMEDRIQSLSQTKVILLTTAKMRELIPYFAASHTHAKPPRVHVGYDSSLFVPKTFLYQPLPQVNVYDRNRKLIKSFVSDVVADSLHAWAY
jgi:hypothetical protein